RGLGGVLVADERREGAGGRAVVGLLRVGLNALPDVGGLEEAIVPVRAAEGKPSRVLWLDVDGEEIDTQTAAQVRDRLARQRALLAVVPDGDASVLDAEADLPRAAPPARDVLLVEADVALAEEFRVIGDRSEIQRASRGQLDGARGHVLALLAGEAVGVAGDRRRDRRRRGRLRSRQRVDEGRQANLHALREEIRVPGGVARIERRRVGGVLRVQVQLTEEWLAQRLEVHAGLALLGPHEG